MISWGRPELLWWLLLAPALAALLMLAWRRRKLAIKLLAHGDSCLAPSARRIWIKHFLWLAAIAFLLLSLADPRYGTAPSVEEARGVNVLFLIDISKSMMASDVSPNRLERAKQAVQDILSRLGEGDRAGIVPFAGAANVYCPLTLDRDALRSFLAELDISDIALGGTDLGGAIDIAAKALDRTQAAHSALVILSDGEDHSGMAADAAKSAAAKGIKIYCLGIGGIQGVPISIKDATGKPRFVTDAAGQMVLTKLDGAALSNLADAGKGSYSPLDAYGKWLDALVDRGVRALEAGELERRKVERQLRHFQIPLLLALALLALEAGIAERARSKQREARS